MYIILSIWSRKQDLNSGQSTTVKVALNTTEENSAGSKKLILMEMLYQLQRQASFSLDTVLLLFHLSCTSQALIFKGPLHCFW